MWLAAERDSIALSEHFHFRMFLHVVKKALISRQEHYCVLG